MTENGPDMKMKGDKGLAGVVENERMNNPHLLMLLFLMTLWGSIQTGEIYYVNRRTGKKVKDDPRKETETSKPDISSEEEENNSEKSNTSSPPPPTTTTILLPLMISTMKKTF
ncbi:hypothetical protein CKAN_01588100 [Cinnamomum micranthum f. kanehirae]|uniref:Uncharacterized protein n=1 Tax=Cinnamomum micranthum f. kanehirae TaxID=337451 RepID=A0A3S3MVI1_9MAGN|nr:hypothetical protein CKAN_01588100 [Cinnamomum micranthum f. kanehirae]